MWGRGGRRGGRALAAARTGGAVPRVQDAGAAAAGECRKRRTTFLRCLWTGSEKGGGIHGGDLPGKEKVAERCGVRGMGIGRLQVASEAKRALEASFDQLRARLLPAASNLSY